MQINCKRIYVNIHHLIYHHLIYHRGSLVTVVIGDPHQMLPQVTFEVDHYEVWYSYIWPGVTQSVGPVTHISSFAHPLSQQPLSLAFTI